MVEAFCISCASNAVGTLMVKPVDYLLKLVKRPLRYLFHYNTIVEELQKQKENLTKEQTRVQEDVREAKMHIQTQAIEEYVENWLIDAENVLKEAESLKKRIGENKRCFRWCPNWSWQYELSKKIERKTLAIKELVKSSKFERVGHRAALPSIEFLNSKDLIATESSTSAFNQIMEALKSDEVNMIGVWGMGGVGKTTLVTKVGNEVKNIQLFNRVIKVVVSRPPSIENIQNEIADFLDFKFEKKTTKGKAEELWLKLKMEEKILIILDDLWDELDLEKIGIPLCGNREGCKIILTTRRKQVCESMESQVKVPLGVMKEDEAWILFKMKACLDSASPDPDIIGVAEKVAKECGGLPIAIVTLARALRSRDLNGWELARRKLERSRLMDIERVPKEVDQNAYLCLEMSYKYLEREPTKRCFLLCALYPEDYSIDVEDLVRHAWALRLYQDADSIKQVRSEVFEAIDILEDSCLLSKDDDEKRYIKVHDVVRDVALWIASNEDNGLVAKSAAESERQKLEILLRGDYDRQTPEEGFEEKRELKVLSLKRVYKWDDRIFSLKALKSLTNLRALHLENFRKLEGISTLAELTELGILCFRHSTVQEPIDKLGELKNLKVLDIRHCRLLGLPPNLIRRLVKLEELYLHDLTIEGSGESLIPGFLAELNLLPNLASLSLSVSSQDFPKDFVFPELERYTIAIGTNCWSYKWADRKHAILSRSLIVADDLPANVISELLGNVEFLRVSNVKEKDIKFLTDTTPETAPAATILQKLQDVIIEDCENLEVIFQMKEAELHLSEVKKLWLRKLPNLEYLWKMPTQHISLRCLKTVKIGGCGKLKSLFSFSLARSLECLEKLEIDGCRELKQIVEESEGDEQEILPHMNPDKPPCLQKLRDLSICECDSMEYIFQNFMAPHGLPQLQKLRMISLLRLKQICRPAKQREENDILLSQIQLLPSLTDLTLHNCPELTDSTIRSLPALASLQLQEVFPTDEENQAQLLSNLERLDLRLLPGLRWVLKGSAHYFSLRSLKVVKIFDCENMKSIFSASLIQSLQQLEELVMRGCYELETVFAEQESDGETESNSHLHPLCLPRLKTLSISHCPRLEYLLPITLAQGLPQLKVLLIEGSDDQYSKSMSQLKQVFGMAKEHDGVEHCIELPLLKDLQLHYLTNLSSFGPENYFVKAPALEKLSACAFRQSIPRGVDNWIYLQGVPLSAFKDFLPNTNHLFLVRIMGYKNLIPNVDVELQGLTSLELKDCNDLECLADTIDEEHVPIGGVFTNLAELVMQNLISLTRLCIGQPPRGFLQNLEMLMVEGCREIVSLYPVAVAQNLKTLIVDRCFKLEEIFGIDELLYNREQNQAPLLSDLDSLEIESAPELRWIVKGPTQYVSLRSLKAVSIRECDKLESLFSSSLIPSLRLLEQLWISHCDKLEIVFTELDGDNATESRILCMPNLKAFHLVECPTLKYVAPEINFIKVPALKDLKVIGCPQLLNFTIQEDNLLQYSKPPTGDNSITSFTADSTLSVRAETKAPRLDDASPSERNIRWSRNKPHSLPPYEEGDEIQRLK